MPIDKNARLEPALTINQNNTLTSFSGADFMVLGYRAVTMNEFGKAEQNISGDPSTNAFVEFANLQTLSMSTTRDIAAERRLGTAWVSGYSRGSRSVAGSLAFTLFDGDALAKLAGVRQGTTREDLSSYIPDDLPPFNIVLSATNEYGHTISGILLNVVVPNSGITVGTQDAYTEQMFSYVAERWIPFIGSLDLKGATSSIINKSSALKDALAFSSLTTRWMVDVPDILDEETVAWQLREDQMDFIPEDPNVI